ncbi:Hsp70 family protein [Nostoc sp. UHCC 0702]|nr:Hsp70 family protein [Nostoc sp. UHCC 0702]
MNAILSLSTLVPSLDDKKIVRERLSKATFVGIDFGTSTTVVSYSVIGDETTPIKTDTIPILQTLQDGRIHESHLVPTVIAWYDEQLLIGTGAAQLKNQLTHNVNIWFSFKMGLGVDLGSQYFNTKLPKGHAIATIETPVDAARVFFKYLKKHIEQYLRDQGLSSQIYYSVSVPASFESNQRRDLLSALASAGIPLTAQALIDEPNAAFLSYIGESNFSSLQIYIPEGSPLHILVFDFGAGTCDISILEIARSPHGFSSKNLAISRFTALGGDDIDRQIVDQVLLPQLLEQNNYTRHDFRTVDLNKRIIPNLQRTAEELKIRICKSIAAELISKKLPAIASTEESIKLMKELDIPLSQKQLKLTDPSMSYQAFQEVMVPFIAESSSLESSDISIFSPIESSLRKADLELTDLDMVLLIGGSSSNPHVQVALHKYFSDCPIEIPSDLRSHVSMGAAINSLILNGMGYSLIRPITSEPIIVITRDRRLQTIISAGIEIPCPQKVFDFCTSEEVQFKIQIPICVGNENKILTVIEIDAPTFSGFEPNTWVKLTCELNEDKVLNVSAAIGNKQVTSTMVNPLANRELTTEERIVFEAEKNANELAARNGGKPTVESLLDLVEACADAGDYLRAAETLETVQMLDKNNRRETNICYYYDKAGNYNQASKWAEIAYQKQVTSTNAYNLAIFKEKTGDFSEYERLMTECLQIDANYNAALLIYGKYLISKKNKRGWEMIERAFNLMYGSFVMNILDEVEYPRLISAAKVLNRNDVVEAVKNAERASKAENKWYSEENLLIPQGNYSDNFIKGLP